MATKTDRLDRTFAALADPTRRAILARLASGEASVTELGKPFEMSLPAVSKHLKVLEQAGLVARGRTRQWRPARLEAGPLKEVADWTERYRSFWEERYDRLDEYLDELQGRGSRPGPRKGPRGREKGDGRKRYEPARDDDPVGAGDRDDPRLRRSSGPRVRGAQLLRAHVEVVGPEEVRGPEL